MLIPEEKIAEILNVSDIVDVISESVMLKKSGRNYLGLCPFHSEKTPSFSVSPHKQIFHCFGCSTGGNVISYLMKYQGVSFPEAVRLLAVKYGVHIETREAVNPEVQRKLKIREGLVRLNKAVMDYYAATLKQGKTAANARQYLTRRKITQDTIDRFSLGYAPDAWDSVVGLFRKMRTGKSLAELSGLVLPKKQGGYYDRFRNRIMFPIFDANMQVTGFGGRVMDDSVPKYLNSPETPVYSKGRILYGLHLAKQYCRQQDTVYIVEGYFDFLTLFQNGITNVVASLGTALTSDHVRILKGHVSRAVLVFDSDAAGVNAARRSIDIFLAESLDVRILVLPQGYDPDSFVMEHGPESFIAEAKNAMSIIDFLVQTAEKKYGLSIEGRMSILDEIKPHLARIEDPAVQSLYLRDISQRLGIDEKAVREKVIQAQHQEIRSEAMKSGHHLFSEETQHDNQELESDRREMQIISLMLQYPDVLKEARSRGVLDAFYSDRLKRIGVAVMSASVSGTGSLADLMAGMESRNDQELLASLAMIDIPETDDIVNKAVALMNRIVQVRKKNESNLTHKIRRAEQKGDSGLPLELLAERQREIRKLHGYE
ncbi:MAG: DNA primase [Pseudomonadota bacterium]